MPTEMTLRDHARGAVRDEVMKHAWELFADQGFEATTVDQIAAAAGMSRRTFFRYFAGKDELVLDRLLEAGERLAETLSQRPAQEPVWQALRAAFDVLVTPQDESHGGRTRALHLMLQSEPALRASVMERRRRWQELLTPLVARRLAPRTARRGPDPRAAAITGSALACLEAAQEMWAKDEDSSLAQLLDEAMGAGAEVRSLPASDR
jgi:AcrR family transcriptional regulator